MKKYSVAVAGATGAVGEQMISILEERDFPIKSLKLLASERSAGKVLKFRGEDIIVETLTKKSFKDIDIALFSAGSSISREFASYAVDSGAVVIDNSSAFRMSKDTPLVIPEVNPDDAFKHKGIIANPNCTTIIMLTVLKPLYDYSRIKRIVVSSYQSASGAGAKGVNELMTQIKDVSDKKKPQPNFFSHQIALNVIPHIDSFNENGYTGEEMKMVNETKKMLGDDEIRVSATCVRVPVACSHSEAVNIETEEKITAEKAKELLKDAPGVTLFDDKENNIYPMPINTEGKDDCYVGRIREDISLDNGLCLWISGDQLRKGAALNAVQIAELLIKDDCE